MSGNPRHAQCGFPLDKCRCPHKRQAMSGKPIDEAVVLARGWLHRRGPGDDYDLHDEASGAGKDCHGCIPCIIVRADAFAQQQGQAVACVCCEDKPAPGNNPCACCGRTAPPSASVGVEGLVASLVDAAYQDGMQELDEMSADTVRARSAVIHALAQQPAADNVPQDAGRVAVHFLARIFAAQEIGTDGEYRGWKISGKGSLNEVVAEARAWLAGQQPAAVNEKYSELLYAVARKYPGESRHETALRYIRQAESADHGPAQAATQHQAGLSAKPCPYREPQS